MMVSDDVVFMQRALELAALGRGSVSPNPMVGCVIVHNGLIVGEGWHQRYGQAHAEVNAVSSVKNPSILSESTAYVTLEPCSHFGKTPPCADLLIKHRLKKVVICNEDPFPLVAGKGIKKLQEAGIEVETGILAKDGRRLNRRFFTMVEQQRPYVILKWAETADEFIAKENFEAVKISNDFSQMYSHKWRSEEDAIMVGTNTAHFDNPSLTVRNWSGRNPIRVVLDKSHRLSPNLNIFNGDSKTIVITSMKNNSSGFAVPTQNISDLQSEVIEVEFNENLIENILQKLHENKIQSLIVEGGRQLLQSFLESGLYDEIRFFKSNFQLKSGVLAPKINFEHIKSIEKITDELSIYHRF